MGRRRGFFAQIQHSIREAERGQRREQRELLARHRHVQRFQAVANREAQRAQAEADKQAERDEAEAEAAEFRNTVALLTSVHRQATPPVDWQAVATSARPEPEAVNTAKSARARQALDSYTPGFFARLFRLEVGQRRRLAGALDEALREEDQRQRELVQEHAQNVTEWEQEIELARLVLAGEVASYPRVVKDTECLAELYEVGCAVTLAFPSRELARVSLRAQEASAVPTEEKSVTARGKLSSKKLPSARTAEIYQDFLCGAALRVARELMAVLPLRAVVVDVWTQLLNPASGHLEDAVVLSVLCPREGMERVNFDRVDASELVAAFKHTMKFSRGKGMAAVTPLDAGGGQAS